MSELISEVKPDFDTDFKINLTVPVLHPDKFADSIGLSAGVVGGWIDQGYIPTVKVGRYRMVNLVKFVQQLGE